MSRKRVWLLGGLLVLFLLAVPTGLFWSVLRPVLHKDIINKHAATYKFDPVFIMALVKVESNFQRDAQSHRGAVGLMQLMPETAREMAQRVGLKTTSPQDFAEPDINVRLGVHYLALLREEFKGDTVAVLAAYNAGPANVRAWRGSGTLTVDEIPYSETRKFVEGVLHTYKWLKRFQKVKNAFNA